MPESWDVQWALGAGGLHDSSQLCPGTTTHPEHHTAGGTGAQIIYELQIASSTLPSLRPGFVFDLTM